MELQGDISVTDPEEADAAASRQALSRSVLAGLVPVLGLFYVWFQAQKRWLVAAGRPRVTDRLLLALACLDTLGVACLLFVGVPRDISKPAAAPAGWIGVQIEPEGGADVVVTEVAAGSPAEEAGLEPGDRILHADGAAIGSLEELRASLAEPGQPRRLDVSRAGAQLALTVIPRFPPKPRLGMFQRAASAELDARAVWKESSALAAVLASCLGMWAWGRRRLPGSDRDWASIAATLAIFGATLVAARVVLFRAFGGWTFAFSLFAPLLALGAYLVSGLKALGRPPLGSGVPRTVGMGVLYAFAGLARAHSLAMGAALFVPGGFEARSKFVDVFAPYAMSPAQLLLWLLALVVVAPLAEEVLFRGLLLPLLARATGPATAALVSSLVFALGHIGYGPLTIHVFAFGLVLAWARLRSGGLAAPFLLHALFNAASALRLLL